ncbi:Ig-like domain-containing protein [Leptospira kmetyi]|uniref:Ig-like domain-containing protein n=1 Tax=Leptospira kmetyi TaxID=408139 RepID=UPI001438490B|nr:Ig-like domain-containing protein [Leptospira kmetyi]
MILEFRFLIGHHNIIQFLCKGLVFAFLGLFSIGCSQLLDNAQGPFDFLPAVHLLGDSTPPKVEMSSPGQGMSGVDPNSEIVVLFSKNMNKPYTEGAFSLSNNGVTQDGTFRWVDRAMIFKPSKALTAAGLYTYVVSKSRAESDMGVNLIDDLRVNFSFNTDLGTPKVITTIPQDGATGVDPNTKITLEFNKPIDIASLYSGISIRPDVPLDFLSVAVSNGNTRFVFTPKQSLVFGTIYTITIANSVRDESGNTLAQPVNISFTVGNDFQVPDLTQVSFPNTSVSNPAAADIPVPTEYTITYGLNKDKPIFLDFTEEVKLSSVYDGVQISPSVPFTVMSANATNTRFRIDFLQPLDVYKIYTLTITNNIVDLQNNKLRRGYVYYLKVKGSYSQKIRVKGIYLDNGFTQIFKTDRINVSPTFLNAASSCVSVAPAVDNCTQPFFIQFCYGESDLDGLYDATCFSPSSLVGDTQSKILLSSVQFSLTREFGSATTIVEYIANLTNATPIASAPAVFAFGTTAFGLGRFATYLLRVKGGTSGVKDNYGNTMDEDYTVRLRFEL